MRTTGSLIVLAMLLCLRPVSAEVMIPVVGQPSPFYGAAGKGVKVQRQAEPVELTIDDTILFTLRVTKLENPADVRRPDLAEIDAFRRDFQVEDVPAATGEPDGTRIFNYHLRPRRASVTQIPSLTFPYYDPERGAAARPTGPPVSQREERRDPYSHSQGVVAASTGRPARRTPVRGRAGGFFARGSAEVGLVGCRGRPADRGARMVWSLAARQPGRGSAARRRRSRAARAALKTLHSLGRHPPADTGAVVWCVSAYLAEHYELPGLFRTPDDMARRLREAGADAETVAECESFLKAADAARFAPSPDESAGALIADAERLVRRQEGEP